MFTDVESIFHFTLDDDDIITIIEEALENKFDLFDDYNEQWETFGSFGSHLEAMLSSTITDDIKTLFPDREALLVAVEKLNERVFDDTFREMFESIFVNDLEI